MGQHAEDGRCRPSEPAGAVRADRADEGVPGSRTKREALSDHLRSLADMVAALPRPGRPQALTDAEVEYLAAGIRELDVDITKMILARLEWLPVRVPSAREGEGADA
jgi:hypothetical protein